MRAAILAAIERAKAAEIERRAGRVGLRPRTYAEAWPREAELQRVSPNSHGASHRWTELKAYSMPASLALVTMHTLH